MFIYANRSNVNTSETNRKEYKLKLNDSLEKEAVAFLNYREGGAIYIGIDKTGVAQGVSDLDGDMLKIKDRLRNNISPSAMGLFDVAQEYTKGVNIIKITVASGAEKPYYIKKYGMSEKGCYVRTGTAAEPMTLSMIDTFYSRRVRNSLNKLPAKRQDLSFNQLKIYYEGSGLILNEHFDRNLELLTDDGKYNAVAYLMSDNNGTSIKVAKYQGVDRIDLIENEEYGHESLVKSTKRVLDKLDLENTTFAQITGKARKTRRLWNNVAVREAVINAIVHNDFTNGIPPKFEIFSDRLEITSTGKLIDDLEKEDFFNGISAPKNPELMRIFRDLDLVEHLGSGIPRILKAYSKDCFIFMKGFIRMSFPKSEGSFVEDEAKAIGSAIGGAIGGAINKDLNLTDRQKEVLLKLHLNPKTSYRKMAEELEISQSAVLKHVELLKEKGYLERIGGTRGYWKIKINEN